MIKKREENGRRKERKRKRKKSSSNSYPHCHHYCRQGSMHLQSHHYCQAGWHTLAIPPLPPGRVAHASNPTIWERKTEEYLRLTGQLGQTTMQAPGQ